MIKETINTAKMDKLRQGYEKVSYSVPEVAEIFGITKYRVRMMVKLGQIKRHPSWEAVAHYAHGSGKDTQQAWIIS